ncbi:MAG: TolC family protein, partial [Elusimicrobia bacterium]|nr:TolC family protein [Elusimicrobiota bacterium]
MKKILLFTLFVLLLSSQTYALKITLAQVEKDALSFSPKIKALENEILAAQNFQKSRMADIYPRLYLQANARYVTEVPSINLPFPMAVEKKLGDNLNYSAGPSLIWNVWDNNFSRFAYKSAGKISSSKSYELASLKRQVVLSARLAYFKAALASERLFLLTDYLMLAQNQFNDIKAAFLAGSKSRADEIMSRQEILTRKKGFLEARSNLYSALSD